MDKADIIHAIRTEIFIDNCKSVSLSRMKKFWGETWSDEKIMK